MKPTHRAAMVLMIVGLVGCDHATKHIAQAELQGSEDISLVAGVLDLTYTENRGVGFNFLRWVPDDIRLPLVRVVGLLVIPLVFVVWYVRRRERWPEHLAYGLMLAGGFGNQLDRLFRGYVIDFIHLHHWPIFNVADICLTFGMLFMAWQIFRSRPKEPTLTSPEPG